MNVPTVHQFSELDDSRIGFFFLKWKIRYSNCWREYWTPQDVCSFLSSFFLLLLLLSFFLYFFITLFFFLSCLCYRLFLKESKVGSFPGGSVRWLAERISWFSKVLWTNSFIEHRYRAWLIRLDSELYQRFHGEWIRKFDPSLFDLNHCLFEHGGIVICHV